MGRFFQTDKPTFVDNNILQLPYQLMANVIGKIDSDIAQNESQVMSLYDQLNANALKQDQPRLREILGGFETEIDDIAKDIQKNPLDFRRKTGDIRNLSRKLNEEFTRGEVAAIQGNFNAFQDFVKRGQTGVKEGDILQEDFEFAKRKFLTDFQGTDFQDGDFQSIFTEDLNKFINIEDIAETRGKEYAASTAELINGFSDGVYIYEDASKEKIMPYEKVYSGVLSSLMNDRELNGYLTQQVRLGAMTPEEYQNTIIRAADRVANKFSFRDTKKSRKLKNDQIYVENLEQRNRKDLAKFKKKLEEDDFNFSPTFNRTSFMLPKDKFNYENVVSYASSLEDDIQQLRDKNVENLSQGELREHNFNIQKKQAALNRLNSIQEKAVQGTMRAMKDQGIITPEDYNNFLAYQDDKSAIDNVVVPIIESINNDIDALELNVSQGLDRQNPGQLDVNQQRLLLKEAAIQQRLREDPAFADAYSKYTAGKAAFTELNEGEKFQIVDGLAIEFEKPNQWLNRWFQENADSNTLYNTAITIDEKDEDFINVLDDVAMTASADAKVLSTTANEFKSDGSVETQQINPEIDDSFFGSNDRFSISALVQKTGKKPSQLFNVRGIEPSANGVRVIYQYDENKIQEAGIDEIEGLQDGQTFMMEFPNTGVESLITDKYSRNKNGKAVEVAKAFSDPVYMYISNEVDNTIKDITATSFEEGPLNNIFVDGLQLKLTARNNPNGGFLYTLSGADKTNGKDFNIDNIRSSDQLKLYIKNYLDVRNSGKLR